MAYPPVVIVNEKDEVIGESQLSEARTKGLIYRVVMIVVKDSADRVLLQKRGPDMQIYPNCWDISAGGHVDDGHDYDEAARMEVEEEIGVADLRLTEKAHFYSEEPVWGIPARRFAKIYTATLDGSLHTRAEDEVAELRWFTKAALEKLFAEHPELVAEGLEAARTHHCL